MASKQKEEEAKPGSSSSSSSSTSTNGGSGSGPISTAKSAAKQAAAAKQGETLQVAMAGKDSGDIGLLKELLAMLTLGLIMSWYYLVVIISVACLVGAWFPNTRAYAITAFVLLWSTNFLPLDYQGAWGLYSLCMCVCVCGGGCPRRAGGVLPALKHVRAFTIHPHTHTHTYIPPSPPQNCISNPTTVWDGFCNSALFRLWRAYFHYEWLLEESVDPKKRYMFAEMPHGIFPWGGVYVKRSQAVVYKCAQAAGSRHHAPDHPRPRPLESHTQPTNTINQPTTTPGNKQR